MAADSSSKLFPNTKMVNCTHSHKKKKKDHALHNLKVLEEKTEAQTSKGDLNRTHSKLCATSQRLTHKHFFVQHPLRSLVSNLGKVTIQTITNM